MSNQEIMHTRILMYHSICNQSEKLYRASKFIIYQDNLLIITKMLVFPDCSDWIGRRAYKGKRSVEWTTDKREKSSCRIGEKICRAGKLIPHNILLLHKKYTMMVCILPSQGRHLKQDYEESLRGIQTQAEKEIEEQVRTRIMHILQDVGPFPC